MKNSNSANIFENLESLFEDLDRVLSQIEEINTDLKDHGFAGRLETNHIEDLSRVVEAAYWSIGVQ